LVKAHNIRTEEIARIRVEAPYETVCLGTKLPATTEEAQFNLAWPLAALLIDGEVGPAQMPGYRFGDQRIRSLVEKIELVESEELNELYRLAITGDPQGKYASVVTIMLTDGRTFKSGIVEGDINYPQEGWDEDRIEDKFRWLTRYVVDGARSDELVEAVWHFEQVQNVSEFVEKRLS
jgi:2-methylcitrate dehydratase PrpD